MDKTTWDGLRKVSLYFPVLGHMFLNYPLVARVQKNLQLGTPNQARVEGSLKFKEKAFLDLRASEGSSLRMFGCSEVSFWLLEDNSLQEWKGPSGFSLGFCSFQRHLVPCWFAFQTAASREMLQKATAICRERQGWELSQENTYSFCSLRLYSIFVCFTGASGAEWGNKLFKSLNLAQIFWTRVFREKNKIWEGFGETLNRQGSGGEEGILPIKKGSELWKAMKMSPILSHKGPDSMWPLMGV